MRGGRQRGKTGREDREGGRQRGKEDSEGGRQRGKEDREGGRQRGKEDREGERQRKGRQGGGKDGTTAGKEEEVMLQTVGKAERREYRSFLCEDEVCLLGVKMF